MATVTATKAGKGKTTAAPADVCRMTLEINGTPYRVSPIKADGFGARRAFRLKRDAATIHHVIEQIHGVECSCGDFVFRRDGLDPAGCKHVRALRAVGLIGRD